MFRKLSLITKSKENLLAILLFSVGLFFYLTKLDYHYFFTDEILYYQKGEDMLVGIFDNTLQVPPLQKYIAGISYKMFNPDLYLMRLIFAIFGFSVSIVIFYIVKRELGIYYGILASFLYLFSKIIFDSSRMMMLEPVLHLTWVLFLYLFYNTLSKKDSKLFIISGIFLGLALVTKVTSLLLILLVSVYFIKDLLNLSKESKKVFRLYFLMLSTSLLVVFIFYLPQLYFSGILNTIKDTVKDLLGVYFDKSVEGKLHVVNGNLYTISPWWFYFDAQFKNDGIFLTTFKYVFGIIALFSKNKFAYFWALVFILSFSFHQLSGVKNVRYISTFEIPLIILSVYGFYYLLRSINKKFKVIKVILLVIIVSYSLINMSVYLLNLKHTEYLGLFNYFKNETENFQIKKRIFVFGSIRTLKYYTKLLPEERFLTYKREYNIYCPEFNEYSYFAFDKEELIKNPENNLYLFVNTYIDNFEKVNEVEDMIVYKKIREFNYSEFCK